MAEAQQQQEPSLAAQAFMQMSDNEFQQWRHSPGTRAFLGFLAEKAENYQDAALELWRSGTIKLTTEQEILGRLTALEELTTINLQSIQLFFKEKYQLEQPEAKTT